MDEMILRVARERVRARAGITGGDSWMDPVTLDSFVNDAIRIFETEHTWPWCEHFLDVAYARGLEYIAIPAAVDEIRDALLLEADGSWTPIDVVAPRTAAEFSTSQRLSPPTILAVYAGNLWLSPRPANDVTLRLLHSSQSTPIVNDDDMLPIPDRYIEPVICQAAKMCAERDGKESRVVALDAAYQQALARCRKKISKTDRPITPQVRSGSWYELL